MTKITIWDLLLAAFAVGLLVTWAILGANGYGPVPTTRVFPTLTPTPLLLYLPTVLNDTKPVAPR